MHLCLQFRADLCEYLVILPLGRGVGFAVVIGPEDKVEQKMVRFRTLGCYPLTGALPSSATTLPDIIREMLLTKYSERSGRLIDHDEEGSMETKKREGYF